MNGSPFGLWAVFEKVAGCCISELSLLSNDGNFDMLVAFLYLFSTTYSKTSVTYKL